MILPNQLTILRIALTPIFFVLFLSGSQILMELSLLVFLIAALTDWYDGWLARKFNYFTQWGKFMDPLADKILTASAFIGFSEKGLIPLWMVILILVRDFAVTGFRGFAEYRGFSFPTSKYAKWKTFLQMFFQYYLLVFFIGKNNFLIQERFASMINDYFLNYHLIYYSCLAITLITVHSGILYFAENKTIFKKLFYEHH